MLPEGTQVSGSIGGTTYSHNKFGAYKRTRSIPTNPSTGAQQDVRSNMQYYSQQWKSLQSDVQDTWNSLAAQLPKQNKLGQTIYLTGFMLYVSGMCKLSSNQIPVSDVNPSSIVPVLAPSMFTALDLDGGVNLESNAAWNTGVDTYYTIEATPCVSGGVTAGSVKNKFRWLLSINGAVTDPLAIQTEYIAKFGNLTPGKQVFVRVTAVNKQTGIASVPQLFNNFVP